MVVSADGPKGMYKCLNGIRFIALMYVIIGHTFYLGPYGDGHIRKWRTLFSV